MVEPALTACRGYTSIAVGIRSRRSWFQPTLRGIPTDLPGTSLAPSTGASAMSSRPTRRDGFSFRLVSRRTLSTVSNPSIYSYWLALLLLPLTTAPAFAEPPGQIGGTVHDATGGSLTGVAITIEGPAPRATATDSDGTFTFPELPPGDYVLSAALTGFQSSTRTVHVVAGQKTTISLTLAVQLLQSAIVTAEKTGARDVQTTPIAVSVVPGGELERMEAHTVADIAGLAPSVTFSQNSDFSQLTIRGIGTNVVFAGSDPSSAVYVDGVYLARPAMALSDFLDLERVEVLRGPQGTLYGRNAVGGALNLITRTPTNEMEASARFVAGNLNTYRGEARFSGPIVRDRIMISGAILRGVADGFVRDLDHPDHPLGGEDVTAALSKIRIVFNRSSELVISGDLTNQDPIPLTYAKVLAVKPGFQVDNPPDLHEIRTSTLAESRRNQYGASARLTFRPRRDITVTSLSAFRKFDYNVVNDADITELDLTSVDLREMQHQVSQELTVAQQRSRLTWVAGVFALDEVDRQPTLVQLRDLRLENKLDPKVEANSTAGFGQGTLDLTRRVSLTAGLRGTRERKTIDNAGQIYTLDLPLRVVAGSTYQYTDRITDSAWTPKFGIDVRPSTGTMVYASATRGFKSGGFNFSSPAPGRGYAPEWAWSYEAGLKTSVAGGRARVNIAAFHTDFSDLQVQTPIRPGVLDISNAAEATIRGVEVEGATGFGRALQVGGHLAWLDATYDRYIAVGPGGVIGDAAGHRLSNAPEWSGRTWVEWSIDARRAGLFSLRAENRWQSTVFFTPFNDAIQRQRAYGLLDLNASLAPRRTCCSVAIYARNLTNQDYITGTFSTPPPAIGGRPGPSRQVGVQLTVKR